MSRARELANLGGSTDAGGLTGRNLLINGAMTVAQRGTSSTTNGFGSVDRWQNSYGGGTATGSQESLTSSDAPYDLGFRKFFRMTNTATTSGAGDYRQMIQRIEAQNIANSGWNYTSTSSYVTLSFWVRSSVAGKYGIYITTDDVSYQFTFTETLAANTWTKVTKTIPGNSNLVFNNDNGIGLSIQIVAWIGTAFTDSTATVDSWVALDLTKYLPDDIVNWAGTSSATFDLTGVQLEVGPTATDFEHEDYGTTLRKCQRYYEVENGIYVVSADTTVNGNEYYTGFFATTKCKNANVSVTGTWTGSTPTVEAATLNSYRITSGTNFYSNGTGNVVADAEL
jgi:hypothetical protein